MPQDNNSRVDVSAGNGHRPVGRAIVHYNHLEIFEGLGKTTFDRPLDRVFSIVHRGNDAEIRCIHKSVPICPGGRCEDPDLDRDLSLRPGGDSQEAVGSGPKSLRNP